MPYVYISTHEKPDIFLAMLATIASGMGYKTGKLIKRLDFFILEINTPNGVKGQLCYDPHNQNRIRVEVFASQPMSHENYFEYCKEFYSPVIKSYNRSHGTRLRLYIKSPDAERLKLPPKSRQAFDSFLSIAGKPILYLGDWHRFYAFIQVCHRTRVTFTYPQLKDALVENGFSDKYASYIEDIGMHLLAFQKSR